MDKIITWSCIKKIKNEMKTIKNIDNPFYIQNHDYA